MNQMNAFLKDRYDMKTFNHVDLSTTIPDIQTETIKGKRFYITPEGKKYPSITTVLSTRKNEGLVRWRESVGDAVANNIMRGAAKRGTAVHTLVENYLNNEELSKQDVLPVALFTLLKPELDNINSIRMQEGGLYSDKWEVAGRVDLVAEFDGELSIIDFKTSAEPKREAYLYDYFVQETAYACCFQELYSLTVKKLVTIVACENGETQVVIKPPKKEYLLKLIEYIDEYQTYGKEKLT